MRLSGDDATEIEALRTDRYLEALLAAGERDAADVPADVALDPAVRLAATRLARELVRVHPSFRFEERLAGRLAAAARAMRAGRAGSAAPGGVTVAFGLPASGPGGTAMAALDPRDLRPYLIGGAVTSAALSLAGAAWVAWRRTHHAAAASPMVRAARAARGRTARSGWRLS